MAMNTYRTSREAFGRDLAQSEFADQKHQGDYAVIVTVLAVAALLSIISFVFDLKLGG